MKNASQCEDGFSLFGPPHLSQPVTCEAVCSQSLQQFQLINWKQLQDMIMAGFGQQEP